MTLFTQAKQASLVELADIALYDAKAQGRSSAALYIVLVNPPKILSTERISIMVVAILVTAEAMQFAPTPLGNFVQGYPTIVMLAPGFFLLIGTMLIAEVFGAAILKAISVRLWHSQLWRRTQPRPLSK